MGRTHEALLALDQRLEDTQRSISVASHEWGLHPRDARDLTQGTIRHVTEARERASGRTFVKPIGPGEELIRQRLRERHELNTHHEEG